MRVHICFATLLLAIACSPSPAQATHVAADVTGTWELRMKFPASGITGMVMGDMKLTQTGSTFTGTIVQPGPAGDPSERPIKGKLVGNAVTFTINFEGGLQNTDVTFSGKLADSISMNGSVRFPDFGDGTWTATKH